MPTISKKKKEDTGGPVDEKGNPFPIDNPEGGDPICPGGYKIDYDFDPLNDPINPPFRCISSLKDPNDGKQNLGINNIVNMDMSSELQTDDDTTGGGRSRGSSRSRHTQKYKHTSYSKTRRRYRNHRKHQ